MATWYSLPIEIQTIILKLLQSNGDSGTTSNYAAVSKEWQLYFERFNFRRLILNQSCIPEFGRAVRQHRRGMVKHVWLRVELAPYLCPACRWPERPLEILDNNQTFTAALYQLLEVLSTWKKNGQYGVSNGGLVLELSAYSPSDSEHYFKYPLGKDDYPHKYDESCVVDDSVKAGLSGNLQRILPLGTIPLTQLSIRHISIPHPELAASLEIFLNSIIESSIFQRQIEGCQAFQLSEYCFTADDILEVSTPIHCSTFSRAYMVWKA
ncbi:hypothetical protein GGI35DRAFT_154254 [Trichoderma velutinum]